MFELKRVTDQVFNRRAADRAASSLAEVRQRAGVVAEDVRKRGSVMARKAYDRGDDAARMAYEYAMNHRKATAAVLLGTGIAAALIYMVNRNGGYAAIRRKVTQRVRGRSGTRRRVAQAQ
jgi:ElaB/YqjD/DUF883 family membrane-anchored ribosome-binding protein